MAIKIEVKPKEKRLLYSHSRQCWSVIEYEQNGDGKWRAARIVETGLTAKQAKLKARHGVRWGVPALGLARIDE